MSDVTSIATDLSDAPARAAALDTTASFIVEAPAGSGKTGLLLQRYLKLLASPSVLQPEEVLAATFTNKATNELRERVLETLHAAEHAPAAADKTPSEFDARTVALAADVLRRDAALGWGLLAQPQRLGIRTLDSLSAEIARALPLLSRAGAPRSPSSAPEELYRLASERTLRQLGGVDTALNGAIEIVLLHHDANLSRCTQLLAEMLQWREQWAELIPLSAGERTDDRLETETRPRLERALETIVCAGLTRATRALDPAFLHELAVLAAELSGEPGYKSEPSPIALCKGRNAAPGATSEHLQHWLSLFALLLTKDGKWRSSLNANHLGIQLPAAGKQSLLALLDRVRDNEPLREALCAVRNLPPPHYPDDQWHVAKALFHLLVRALAELKLLFAEQQTCDFTEIALAARAALAERNGAEDFSAALGMSLRHLLIDEMQDTSAAQYDLIQRLTSTWDGHSQTLFLVGDPKQSIYAFRQARVERFLRTVRESHLGDIPLTPLQLTANFRSRPSLIKAFNDDFKLIFPLKKDDIPLDGEAFDVPFVEAQATRSADDSTQAAKWHTAILGKDDNSEDSDKAAAKEEAKQEKQDYLAREASEICDTILLWRNKPLPVDRKRDSIGEPVPWSIAILIRARSHVAHILPALRAAGIAYRAVEIEPLTDRPEVLDALALTRALLHLADRTAWLAALHAPWCGLGMADLLAVSGAGLRENAHQSLPAYFNARREFLTPIGQQLLDRVLPALEAALAQRGRTTLTTLVERTWLSLGGDTSLSPDQLTNVREYFRLLHELEQPGGRIDLARLTERMEKLCAAPQSLPGAVEILTMHKAKGLEWDVVLLPGLERKPPNERERLLNWLELDSAPDEARVILAPIHGVGEESSALQKWLKNVRQQREAAERKRLVYVAFTRAREELHLFAAATRKKSGELCAPANSLLHAAWPAAESRFQQEAAKAVPNESSNALHSAFDASLAATPQPGPRLVIFPAKAAQENYASTFDLAAGAAGAPTADTPAAAPLLHRFPLRFDPRARFAVSAENRLPYPDAATLPIAANFNRPEGSYEARALGNVIHRYLQLLSDRLAAGITSNTLQAEVEAAWLARLSASLRAEGLPATAVRRAAATARRALQRTLADPTGLWLLSPHTASSNECALRIAAENAIGLRIGLRIDRSFVAGAAPQTSADTHFWIVDFKTSAQSIAVPTDFDTIEREKYGPQLEAYARAQRELSATTNAPTPIMLALYYPLLPRLISWPAKSNP